MFSQERREGMSFPLKFMYLYPHLQESPANTEVSLQSPRLAFIVLRG